jgi:hypothetical protein
MNKPFKVTVEITISSVNDWSSKAIAQVKREETCQAENLVRNTVGELSDSCLSSIQRQFECAIEIERLQLQAAAAKEGEKK